MFGIAFDTETFAKSRKQLLIERLIVNLGDEFVLVLLIAFVVHQLTMFFIGKTPTLITDKKIRLSLGRRMDAIALLNGDE